MAKFPLVISLIAMILGFGSGAWWYVSRENSSPNTSPDAHAAAATAGVEHKESSNPDSRLYAEIVALKKALEEEVIARRHLEEVVARLEKTKPPSPAKTYTTVTEHEQPNKSQARNENQLSFESALVAIGLDASRVSHIRQRLEQMELQQIYLRNQAEREGWLTSPRYTEERRKLEDREGALRTELGDESYDRYLFMTGEENRVAVQSVISSSAAQAAGITAGDIVFRYDHQRIFSWADLTRAAAMDRSGDTVPVEIHRNGQHLTVYMPRGPLGIRIEAQLEKPGT